MPIPHSKLEPYTGSISFGSYINEQDTELFSVSQSSDLFFGYSNKDIMELSIFDDSDIPISWSVIHRNDSVETITSTYLDTLNNVQSYTYNETINDLIIYKNQDILLNVISDLSSSGIVDGTYKVSYVFSRDMAGSNQTPLIINEISPSRTEIKLIPKNNTFNSSSYKAFCFKKFVVSDVSPILLSLLQQCPYDKIYSLMLENYKKEISLFKNMFFLLDDGSTIQFLKNVYEDYIKYTSLSENQINSGIEPTRVYRIQGIKTYFNNYLLQQNDSIQDFSDLETIFSSFVNLRIEQLFIQYKNQPEFNSAKQFCYDFFVEYFYKNIVNIVKIQYQNKYFSPLKNVLNFGNNKYFTILNSDYLDERQSIEDPYTLIVKLNVELPSDISVKEECWVSNFSMVPYIFTTIVKNPIKYKTLKIGAPNFGTTNQFINKENVNKLYSSEDLTLNFNTQNDVNISKKISNLNIDYSDFNNFVVFSSATTRVNIFKNKIKTYYNLVQSLSDIELSYNNSLSSSITYPYYLQEKQLLEDQIKEIMDSFDGYESHLFNTNAYVYNTITKTFVDNVLIYDTDYSASIYDKYNRDSLINNVPEYLINDAENNQDYLTFLSMTGHHFDNIYTYISALPIERQVKNHIGTSIPLNTLKELLYSFGWNVDDIINNLNIDQVYLNSLNSSTYNSLSSEQRLQIIWNRILVTLPGIYKTKGTEECVKFLMACYGLPSSLISIREYGSNDYIDDSEPTYKLDEKLYMLRFSGNNDKIEGPFPSSTKTIEFKFSIESSSFYQEWQRKSLLTSIPYQETEPAWSIDIYKTPGEYTGKISFQMKSGSTGEYIVSDALPIFNGQIFSVMLRKNDSNENFEYDVDSNNIPIQYDLIVQRNENGKNIFKSKNSKVFLNQDNHIFSKYGRFLLSDGNFIGTLDKLHLWDVPISDDDFEEHVNDLNSYAYSGSNVNEHLLIKLNWDYPQNMYTGSPSLIWIDNKSSYYYVPNYRESLWISSSIIPSTWTSSNDIVEERWSAHYPTGSIDIIGMNFPMVMDNNWSSSYNCGWQSSSVYPWHFRELEYQQDLDGSKFGPNKFKNKKIRKLNYSVEARFDANDRSTFNENVLTTGDSNQIGFFIDPQDAKNKDIIRYVGKNGIMDLIGDPRNLYKDKYYDLTNKRYEYHSSGNKKTLFNEMLTIFKFYFDKSIFEAIKNIIPARANLFTGVVIEPTILERPKYQNKPLISNIDEFNNVPGTINDIVGISPETLWGEFGSSSIGYNKTVDLKYVSNPVKIMSDNVETGIGGYVDNCMDRIQFCRYADFEKFPRLWEKTNSAPSNWPTKGINGSISYDDYTDNRLIIDENQNSRLYNPLNPISSGYNNGSHQILYYMLKVWDRYNYCHKRKTYIHSNNPNLNEYNSASVYLYNYIIVSEPMMRELVYWYTDMPGSPANTDPSLKYIHPNFYHESSTFIGTPNQKVSNVYLIPGSNFPYDITKYTLGVRPTKRYFEIASGYPRNHYTHKMTTMSKNKHPQFQTLNYNTIFVKGRNTIDTTVDINGMNDGTFPVSSNNVSNMNVINTDNVIQYTPKPNIGSLIPGAKSTTTSVKTAGGTNSTSNTNTTPQTTVNPPSTGTSTGEWRPWLRKQ